ncbi:Endo-1,4-beta-xylanase [Verticillium dahliae VDG1]|nr:Endo-1,4-beta-xylanase [Verticillium dahliae VDG1]
MIGIALLGAGLFAQEQHLPAIQSSQAFELRAVYSRSLKSASALSANSASPDAVTTYADDHPTPSRSLADLLARTDDVSEVSARTALLQAKLAPVDTVHAVAKTDRGAIGTMSISFGTEFKSGFEVQVVTTEGSVTMTPVDVKVAKRGQDGKKVEERREFTRSSGVPAELEAFGASLEQGTADERQNTAQALKDLAILQGLLESATAAAAASAVTSTAAAAAAAITTVAVPVVATIASIARENVTACVMAMPPSVPTTRLTAPVA